MKPIAVILAILLGSTLSTEDGPRRDPFRMRGYYVTFTRMPTLGLRAWKQTLNCMKEDGANTLILWIGGGFRSCKFPITWRFNSEHQNIRKDFVRELIDCAHGRGIRVLLGFTPFGYDGVNQYALEHPELIATGPDGKPAAKFGIYSWGYNLCPSQPQSQRFMREYARELYFDFYPNADGLFIESSDYAICHCHDCGARFFEKEFAFVRQISDDVWTRKSAATILVYPHYFSGARIPFAQTTAAKLPFDRRWTLFFTPHSAAVVPELMKQAAGSVWWNDGPAFLNVERIREGARQARQSGCIGYIPSIECFSYVPTQLEEGQPWLVGKRLVPFGFGWLKTGECPYRELPVRLARLAYLEFTRDPDLSMSAFKEIAGRTLLGPDAPPQAVEDLVSLTEVFGIDRGWSTPPALTAPAFVRYRMAQGKLPAGRFEFYRRKLDDIREIARRYRQTKTRSIHEMATIAQWIVDRWEKETFHLPANPSDILIPRQQ